MTARPLERVTPECDSLSENRDLDHATAARHVVIHRSGEASCICRLSSSSGRVVIDLCHTVTITAFESMTGGDVHKLMITQYHHFATLGTRPNHGSSL